MSRGSGIPTTKLLCKPFNYCIPAVRSNKTDHWCASFVPKKQQKPRKNNKTKPMAANFSKNSMPQFSREKLLHRHFFGSSVFWAPKPSIPWIKVPFPILTKSPKDSKGYKNLYKIWFCFLLMMIHNLLAWPNFFSPFQPALEEIHHKWPWSDG